LYLSDPHIGTTKQCFWIQSLHRFRDFLLFNDVGLLARGFSYSYYGVAVYVWPWEERDGYGVTLDFHHELKVGEYCRLLENNKRMDLEDQSPDTPKGAPIQIFIITLRGEIVCMRV